MAAKTIRVDDKIFLQDGFPQTIEPARKIYNQSVVINISEFIEANAGITNSQHNF